MSLSKINIENEIESGSSQRKKMHTMADATQKVRMKKVLTEKSNNCKVLCAPRMNKLPEKEDKPTYPELISPHLT